MKKYTLGESFQWRYFPTISQIRSKNKYGGYVEGEHNLSHEGNCWIPDDSIICGRTRIEGDLVIPNHIHVKYTVANPEKLKSYRFKNSWYINYSGFDEKTKEHFIRVGCQIHSINSWKNPEFRKMFVRDYELTQSDVKYLLGILSEIEKDFCQDPLEKIEENVKKMKVEVTEPLKTETISLISSLPVSKNVLPNRVKFGRFVKKGS